MRQEDLRAVNDGIELHGTFALPAGAGPHPTILALHAADAGTRDARLQRHVHEVLPANGIAVLTYDRRGDGASIVPAGTTVTFDDKASDARAWLELLHAHPGVDASRIGIWGHSQAGWIGPMAANGRNDVSLMALVSACAVTPAEQMQFGYGYQILEAGYSEENAQRGIDLRRFVDDYWRGAGVTEREAVAAIDAARGEPWFDIAPPTDPRRSSGRVWKAEMDLDITPTIARLGPMPILLFFGERDQWVPARDSEARWRDSLPPDADLTVEILPGATHFPTPDHDGEGPLAPRYEELLVSWLRDRFGLGDPARER